ncbi:hypothetical protein P7C70_g4451, partial [Phenoliferia sp. Uapishka_3]
MSVDRSGRTAARTSSTPSIELLSYPSRLYSPAPDRGESAPSSGINTLDKSYLYQSRAESRTASTATSSNDLDCTGRGAGLEAKPLPRVDGGKDAWLFVASAFILETTIWGYSFSFGIIQVYLNSHPPFNTASIAAVSGVGTVGLAMQYILPVGIILIPRQGAHNLVDSHGGFLSFHAYIKLGDQSDLSWPSFVYSITDSETIGQVWQLVLLQGVICGTCGAILYAPVLLWLQEWFVERRGCNISLLNELVDAALLTSWRNLGWRAESSSQACLLIGSQSFFKLIGYSVQALEVTRTSLTTQGLGSDHADSIAVGGFVFPFLIGGLLEKVGFAWTVRIWAAFTCVAFGCALLTLRPRLPVAKPKRGESRGRFLPLDLSFLWTPTVLIMCATTFVSSLSFFPVSLYIPTYTVALATPLSATVVLAVYNAASVLGQVGVGWFSDRYSYPAIISIIGISCSITAFFSWGYADTLGKVFGFVILFGSLSGICSVWSAVAREVSGQSGSQISSSVLTLRASKRRHELADLKLGFLRIWHLPRTGFDYWTNHCELFVPAQGCAREVRDVKVNFTLFDVR